MQVNPLNQTITMIQTPTPLMASPAPLGIDTMYYAAHPVAVRLSFVPITLTVRFVFLESFIVFGVYT